jgi:hypothetical protein
VHKPTEVELLQFTPPEEVVLQYIKQLYSHLNEVDILKYIAELNDEQKREVSEIIFNEHDQYNHMRNMGDVRSSSIFKVTTALSYLRDLNRHRAFGRFTPLFEEKNWRAILKDGFNMNYQIFNTDGLSHLSQNWSEDAQALYEELNDLGEIIERNFPDIDSGWLLRLLPLGHNSTMHFSAPVSQLSYMINQRANRPGDYGYVYIATQMLEELRKKSPLYEGLAPGVSPVDLNSFEEFTQRK